MAVVEDNSSGDVASAGSGGASSEKNISVLSKELLNNNLTISYLSFSRHAPIFRTVNKPIIDEPEIGHLTKKILRNKSSTYYLTVPNSDVTPLKTTIDLSSDSLELGYQIKDGIVTDQKLESSVSDAINTINLVHCQT